MSKKTITLCVALILALTLGLGGTLAYLTDTDADKNVMTVGRVQIVQNEQQRVEEDGEFIGALVPFENEQMLLPVTGRDNTPDTITVGDWEVTLDDDLNNYIDKIISATNTGNTDAWVRTLVAVPTGAETDDPEEYWNKIESASDNWLHWNAMPDPAEGEQWSWPAKDLGLITVDDVVYAVFAFTHHEKVAPGETTYPVVRGLYMDERVDMDVVKDEEGELVDQYYMMVNGEKQVIYDVPDKNGKVNMLVLTQAVQADGFATAEEAFDKAFALGDNEAATLFNWFGGDEGWDEDDIGSPGDKHDDNNPPDGICSLKDLINACKTGGTYALQDDIIITPENYETYFSKYIACVRNDTTIDLNGHTISVDAGPADSATNAPVLFYVYDEGVSLTVKGEGDVWAHNYAFLVFPRTVSDGAYIYGGNWHNVDGDVSSFNDYNAIVYAQGGKAHIYGGSFDFVNVGGHCGGFNVYDNAGADMVLHEGVLLSDSSYFKGSDADEIHLAEGCALEEVVIDGETWYKVVKE